MKFPSHECKMTFFDPTINEGCSDIIETPSVNNSLNKLKIMFVVVM